MAGDVSADPGCAILGMGLPKDDAVHGLMTGAVGVMTLAVMTHARLSLQALP